MSARRLKLILVFGGLVLGAFTLLAWTQPWFDLILVGGQRLPVSGQSAAPALSALGLASLALFAALTIAGRAFRIALGVIEAGIGVLVAVTAVAALGDPVAASGSALTDATAVSGAESLAALVQSAAPTAWPSLAVAAGALAAVLGVLVVVTSGRWPGPTRKYESARTDEGTAGAWDALSDGHDPTAR
ncbi:MAG: hypothetical protein JWN36_2809 [Microbacteriaceae bacterium]|nr:hypothetical protein [Microbacteriaceae bacterium]